MEPPVYVQVFGATIAIPSEDADETRELREQWSRCLVDAPTDPAEVVQLSTYVEPDRVRRHYLFVSELTFHGIRQLTGQELMLHAAGAADLQTGKVIVLVAESGTGKTTASVRLCTNGFGYVSDETIAIDEQLRIRQYPKPLSVIIDPTDPLHKSQHGPDELGMTPPPDQLTLGAIVLLDRDKEGSSTGEPWLEPLETIDAVSALIPQSSALPSMDAGLLRLATAIEAVGGAYRLHYREIDEAIPVLRGVLGQSGPTDSKIIHHPSTQALPVADRYLALEPPTSVSDIDTIERSPYTDAIEADGSIELLCGSVPVRLSGIGPFVWRASTQPCTRAAMVARCITEFGDHPTAADLVDTAIDDMLVSGVLRAARS